MLPRVPMQASPHFVGGAFVNPVPDRQDRARAPDRGPCPGRSSARSSACRLPPIPVEQRRGAGLQSRASVRPACDLARPFLRPDRVGRCHIAVRSGLRGPRLAGHRLRSEAVPPGADRYRRGARARRRARLARPLRPSRSCGMPDPCARTAFRRAARRRRKAGGLASTAAASWPTAPGWRLAA